jgi:predicted transcriptional regulator
MPASDQPTYIDLTVEILSAFVRNNAVTRSDLPALIDSVHAALVQIASGATVSAKPEAPTPAVSVRASVKPDYLVCLDDGKKFKSLRRHLAALGMTPEQYRAKWSLPSDYPMVSANYAAQRSELAKRMGLGQKGGNDSKQKVVKAKDDKPKNGKSKRARRPDGAKGAPAA